MAQVSLSKALKLKNRLAQQIAELQRQMQEHNRYVVGSEFDYDTKALYEELKVRKERLVSLKAAISDANRPIQADIYRLAELKGLVAFLRAVETRRGRDVNYGLMAPTEYEAQITAPERDAEVSRLEVQIDAVQDRLDYHNATVQVEVEEA